MLTDQCIYLLHFDQPIGRCSHYIGRTSYGRLCKRLREHSRGQGACLTRLAASRGVGFTLAQLWITAETKAEQALKARGHARKLCTTCRPDLRSAANHLVGLHYAATYPRPQWCDFSNWPTTEAVESFSPLRAPLRPL